jgi:methylenetetrahydrofolate dehydrogenase (NADP+)/methenyltetrahydrofolate cyclohydrolase
MSAHIIDGKRHSADIKAETARDVAAFIARTGITPKIVFLLVGNNPASEVYVRNKGIAAAEAGFAAETLRFNADISEAALLETIAKLNADTSVNAMLCQLPVPKHISEEAVIEAIAPAKDIDGFHPINVGRLSIGRGNYFIPCTPAGIMELLRRENIDPAGKHVVVVGRSNIVGKPIASLLAQKATGANAVVTLAHTGAGSRLKEFTRSADILITAIGVPKTITADMVSEGVVVIDVGMNSIPDATKKSGQRLVGDVDFENVKEVASAITPVPGGVGPMTIALVLRNSLLAAERQYQ